MLRLGNRQVVTIDLHGELDLSTGEEIAARINETLTSAGITRIAIDLADVTFLDCHTIGVLLREQRIAAAHAVRLYVVNVANPLVRAVLDITGATASLQPSTDAVRRWTLPRRRPVAA
jgi:anti-anti-sigma factor